MRLGQALDIRPGEVISLVGGGGKTTLMFALARELASAGGCVITTTTTKIFEPLPSQTQFLLLEADGEKALESLVRNTGRYGHITLAGGRLPSGKLAGVSPDLVDRLAGLDGVSHVIVEADGAKHRSLKAPRPGEPVIPSGTSLLVPVVGVDAVGCRLTEENVFRSRIVSELTGLKPGETVSAESVAFLVTHRQGIIRGCPDGARIVPFINKVDMDGGLEKATELAGRILAIKDPRIKRVVLGQVRLPEAVARVIKGE